ncbi:MAG: CPBP family intramembrane metalloprotease [Candidatus Eremiobacteraeota bacterium]|nr:CPBP family intramembrane metalloprotease [Candidatus Eremiobacteraeota bacterium]
MSGAVALRGALRRARPSPYDIAFWALWTLSLVALAAGGDRFDLIQGVVAVAVFAALYALTRRFTNAPAGRDAPKNVALGAVVVTAALLLMMAEMLRRDAGGVVGAWSALHWWITAHLVPLVLVLDDQSLDNSVRYVIVPGAVLVALGWRARHLGFGSSRRGTLAAVATWSALPLALFGVAAFVIGHGKPALLAHRFFIDIFRNGFAEEVLFRGMVMTLTVRALGVSAGNVAQALVFGLWHVPADLRDVHGVAWLALADAIGTQAIAGYFFGLLTLRTGNVLAAGAAHTLYDGGAVFV